jgi:RimJ/RimL family protein N-acetyltransferase
MWPARRHRPSRRRLLDHLPLQTPDLRIRPATRRDLDVLAAWPGYPWPYEGFDLPFADLAPTARDDLFARRQADPHRVTLIADHPDQPCVVYLGLVQIDWGRGLIGNMGYRVHPAWCDRGIGTCFMRAVGDWLFAEDMRTLRLDVIAANTRAIRCYEKAGFTRTGEFWQPDPPLMKIDLDEPRYAFLRPHVDLSTRPPRLRFYWMQRHRT